MAIIIKTENPEFVRDLFAESVRVREIATWLIDADGDFTIANPKWTYMAWMRPVIADQGILVFGFISSRKHEITRGLYGIYHGRLAATILSHYDSLISSIEIESQLNPHYDSY